MKKAALILTVCIVAVGLFCGHNVSQSQFLNAITPSEKMASDVEKQENAKEAEKDQKQEVVLANSSKTKSEEVVSIYSSDSPLFLSYNLPAIKQGEELQGWSQPNPLFGQLDFNKDGCVDKEDFQLSEMNREEFAKKLVENGNVGTSEEAQWLIDGDISSAYAVMH